MPSTWVYRELLKENTEWWAAISSNLLNVDWLRPKGSSCSVVVWSVIKLVVSLKGKLVYNDSMSKLARVIGWSKFREVTSLVKEVELSMEYMLVVR